MVVIILLAIFNITPSAVLSLTGALIGFLFFKKVSLVLKKKYIKRLFDNLFNSNFNSFSLHLLIKLFLSKVLRYLYLTKFIGLYDKRNFDSYDERN